MPARQLLLLPYLPPLQLAEHRRDPRGGQLDRADRRRRSLPVDDDGAVIEPIGPRDELATRDMLDHAAAAIKQAGLISRQLDMISLQARRPDYEEITARTANSRRTGKAPDPARPGPTSPRR